MGSYRWRICAILFFATTVNYIDRNVLSFTMIDETFRREMAGVAANEPLTEAALNSFKTKMGYVDAAFKTAYALGFLLMGWLIDRIGTRKGFSLAIGLWSVAGVFTGFVNTAKGLSIARFLLGVGEAGNFPSAVKTVAEWFPKKERSLAAGIFNAGANIGVIATAFAVPLITLHFGWRAAFITTGFLGFAVLALWLLVYRKPEQHPRLSEAELRYIQQDTDEVKPMKISWFRLLKFRQTWAFAAGKFFADPIWYFYLTWLPDFFNSNDALEQKLNLKSIGIPFLIIYLVSDGGSVFFGWLSSQLIQSGWSVNKARKITMLICALLVVPIFMASITSNIYAAIALIAVAAAAHQGWSANVFTVASDLFPRQAVGSVVGIGSMFGAASGAVFAASTGIIRVKLGYLPLFLIAACAYLTGLALLHFLSPKLQPVSVDEIANTPEKI